MRASRAESGPTPLREEAAPSSGEVFLRQALGSNVADMRIPAVLLTLALAASVAAYLWRRQPFSRAPESEDTVQPPDRLEE